MSPLTWNLYVSKLHFPPSQNENDEITEDSGRIEENTHVTCLVHHEYSLFLLEVASGQLVTFATVSHCKTFVCSSGKMVTQHHSIVLCCRVLFLQGRGTSIRVRLAQQGLQMEEGGPTPSVPAQCVGQGSSALPRVTPANLPKVTTP